MQFAREAGYQKIVLWTQETLTAARHLYSRGGLPEDRSGAAYSFGHDLVGETWERELHGAATLGPAAFVPADRVEAASKHLTRIQVIVDVRAPC